MPATNTPYFNLIKPGQNDYYNVEDQNKNMDTIDGALKALQGAINSGATEQELGEIRQEIAAHMADDTSHVRYATDIRLANHKTVALPDITEYFDGLAFAFKSNITNSNAVTLNVNSLGAKPLLKSNGNQLNAGLLKQDSIFSVRYSNTANDGEGAFILQGEGGEYGTAGAEQVLTGYTVGTENGVVAGTAPNLKAQPGSVIFVYSPAEKTTTEISFVKVKEVALMMGAGTVRVVFSVKTNGGDSRSQIYVNGIPRGILRSHFSSSIVTFTEDIAVNNGDDVQIYTHAVGTGRNVTISEFKIQILSNPFATIKL
ncbi:hypothetical protein [Sporosarcina sp. UB5]|uniref:hypothetical protein n=1 Tax=Sporosarcina sp. UB5 TaxID=3047463 RepID=UPI003D7A8048